MIDRKGTEAPFRDIALVTDEKDFSFVSVDFGNGAISKAMRAAGLPTAFRKGDRIIDEAGRPILTFELIAQQLLNFGSSNLQIIPLLQAENP